MKKRPVLGKGAASIFEITKLVEESPEVPPAKLPAQPAAKPTRKGPKFKSFEVKLSVLLREDHLDHLKHLERIIMKSRAPQNKIERITKNTILRAYIDALSGLNIDIKEIKNEADILERIKAKM